MDRQTDFIRCRTTEAKLEDGTSVVVRPVVPGDKAAIVKGLGRLSPKSRHLRFMQSKKRLTPYELKYLTEVNYSDHFAWCAEIHRIFGGLGIGIGRYIRLPESREVAEFAVTVVDTYQNRGLGSMLLWTLSETALIHDIRYFRGYTLAENQVMMHICNSLGAKSYCVDGFRVEFNLALPLSDELVEDADTRKKLRAAIRGEIDLLR